MALVEINRNPTRRELRWFAGFWLLLFGVLGSVAWTRHGPEAAVGLGTVAFVVPALGLLRPALLRTVYLVIAYATFPIGFVVSHVILAAVYFLVLTPIGLAARLAGHDPLRLHSGSRDGGFWQERKPATDPRRYFRQY